MRLLLFFVLLMIAGVGVAAWLTIDFRDEASRNYLVQCQLSSSERTLHIVGEKDAILDEKGARGISIKGTQFNYPPEAACTQHPITFEQIEEYLPESK